MARLTQHWQQPSQGGKIIHPKWDVSGMKKIYPVFVKASSSVARQLKTLYLSNDQNKFQKLERDKLPPLVCSQDPATLYDITYFRSIVDFLCPWRFNNQEEVEVSVKEFLAKNKNWYQCGIKELAERWL